MLVDCYADIRLQIQKKTKSWIDDLLPQNWKQLFAPPEAPSA